MNIKVIIAPAVDEAILSHIDYVDIDAIPAALHSIEKAKNRFVETISTFPEGGQSSLQTLCSFLGKIGDRPFLHLSLSCDLGRFHAEIVLRCCDLRVTKDILANADVFGVLVNICGAGSISFRHLN